MESKRRGPLKGRIEYGWRVDRESGFARTALIYDARGRLQAIDYRTSEEVRRESERLSRNQ